MMLDLTFLSGHFCAQKKQHLDTLYFVKHKIGTNLDIVFQILHRIYSSSVNAA